VHLHRPVIRVTTEFLFSFYGLITNELKSAITSREAALPDSARKTPQPEK
jgi:hypothetical protein